MAFKDSVISILNDQRDKDTSEITSKFDGLVSQVEALPADSGDVAELQKQLDDVKATLASEDARLVADEAKIAQIKSLLGV